MIYIVFSLLNKSVTHEKNNCLYFLALLGGMGTQSFAAKDFLNVSYDPTREFYLNEV